MEKEISNQLLYDKIIREIKLVRIQGAEDIARAGIKAYSIKPTKESAKEILSIRETEPLLKNSIRKLLKSQDPKLTAKRIISYLNKSHNEIKLLGAHLIKDGMNIYSHCHSTTVVDILKYAKKKLKKKFVVYTTEVEPLLQGRKTAEELSKSKIKVVISPDLAAESILSKCDLLLFGADAFTKKFVANKIGTTMLVRHAKENNIPRYSCGVSIKFTKKLVLENRDPNEVWNNKRMGIKVLNPAFDKTPLKDLTGVISEFGILKTKDFVIKAKKKLKDF